RIFLLLLLINCNSYVYWLVLSTIPKRSLLAHRDDKVLIVDHKNMHDTTTVIWSWRVSEAKAYIPAPYQKLMIPFAECKPNEKKTKILLTSSGGATYIVDVASRKVEFYANTPMANSAALLPGGYIAVNNSTHPKGNSIKIYHRSKSEELLFK